MVFATSAEDRRGQLPGPERVAPADGFVAGQTGNQGRVNRGKETWEGCRPSRDLLGMDAQRAWGVHRPDRLGGTPS